MKRLKSGKYNNSFEYERSALNGAVCAKGIKELFNCLSYCFCTISVFHPFIKRNNRLTVFLHVTSTTSTILLDGAFVSNAQIKRNSRHLRSSPCILWKFQRWVELVNHSTEFGVHHGDSLGCCLYFVSRFISISIIVVSNYSWPEE